MAKGAGCSRVIIGVIERNAADGTTFRYITEGLETVKKDGCVIYPDFPNEYKVYSDHVLDTFSQRLNKSEREDIHRHYSYKKRGRGLKIMVKNLNKNGHINRAFIKISF